ncbi:MAG: hypothetical protein JSS34_03650 [Proteobacteria bacterium]|nr:hypothetical protein [Pseudomonadota bacterium]
MSSKSFLILTLLLSFPLKSYAIDAAMIGIGSVIVTLGATIWGLGVYLHISPEFYKKCCGQHQDDEDEGRPLVKKNPSPHRTKDEHIIHNPPKGPSHMHEDDSQRGVG